MKVPIKRASTLFLKAVLLLIASAVTGLCAWLFPQIWTMTLRELPEFTHLLYPALVGLFATIVPFLFALYQAFRLLQYIDANNAFSELSVKALRSIKFSAIAMSIFYAMGMPMVGAFAELDDAPGAILMWFAVICTPLVVATFAAVLQKLVQNAVDMKTEHDLTI